MKVETYYPTFFRNWSCNMLKLSEIIRSIDEDEAQGMIDLDDWKLSEIDHLTDMGFDMNGTYKMELLNPELIVYKKKGIKHQLPNDVQAVGEGYVLEDKARDKTHTFATFKQMVEFFDNYEQDFKS